MNKFLVVVVLILSLTGYSQDRVNKSDQFIEVDFHQNFGQLDNIPYWENNGTDWVNKRVYLNRDNNILELRYGIIMKKFMWENKGYYTLFIPDGISYASYSRVLIFRGEDIDKLRNDLNEDFEERLYLPITYSREASNKFNLKYFLNEGGLDKKGEIMINPELDEEVIYEGLKIKKYKDVVRFKVYYPKYSLINSSRKNSTRIDHNQLDNSYYEVALPVFKNFLNLVNKK